MKPFRFGLIGIRAASRQEWREKAIKAEALGYSTLLMWDHFDDSLAPLPALLAAADATTTLRIGTFVLANDFRHPALVAKEAATLDLLSDGRFELGIGAGWKRSEYGQVGLPFDDAPQRVQRLQEAVQIIKRLWQPQAASFHGSHYNISDLVGYPQPLQRPHPPLLIGGARKQMMTFAAQEADIVAFATRMHTDGTPDFRASTGEQMAERVAWVLAAAGERFAQLELQVNVGGVVLTEQRRPTAEQLAPTVGLTAEQLLDNVQALIGTSDEIAEDLLLRRDRYGLSYISVDERFMEVFAPIVKRLVGR